MLWVRLETAGGTLAVANIHASTGKGARHDVLSAARCAAEWSAGLPLVLGGDFNLSPRGDPATFAELRERYGLAPPTAGDAIDHLLATGVAVDEPPRRLPVAERELTEADGRRIRLSDHAPVVVSLRMR